MPDRKVGACKPKKIKERKQLTYHTLDDIYHLPYGQRAELIDGELYMMAAPGRIHQKLVKVLTYVIEIIIGLVYAYSPQICLNSRFEDFSMRTPVSHNV